MKTIKPIIGFSALAFLAACSSEESSVTQTTEVAVASFAAQADAGADAYGTNCAVCHGGNLEGSALGPILGGESFFSTWGMQSPADFFNYIKSNMPPGEIPAGAGR